jgi:hypothetical protein
MKMLVNIKEYKKVSNKWELTSERVENAIVDSEHWKSWRKFDKQLESVKSQLSLSRGLLFNYTTINTFLGEKVVYKNTFKYE